VRAAYAPSRKLLYVVDMPLKTESHVIFSADLQRFAGALFEAAGVASAMADEWAKSLVWANLRGVDSHGVLRIPGYIERLKTKAINPTPNMRVEKRAGAIAVLEADRAPGAVAMAMAMAEAIARARETHVGWCAARNITHAQGRDTTDPRTLATLLPLGGPKGSGLSFMIECLCSLTVGNPIIAPALAAGGKLDAPFLKGVAIARDLAVFGDRERILGEADRLARHVAALAPADGVERIYLPGERGDSILQARMRDGIPLPQGTWSRLLACAKA